MKDTIGDAVVTTRNWSDILRSVHLPYVIEYFRDEGVWVGRYKVSKVGGGKFQIVDGATVRAVVDTAREASDRLVEIMRGDQRVMLAMLEEDFMDGNLPYVRDWYHSDYTCTDHYLWQCLMAPYLGDYDEIHTELPTPFGRTHGMGG